MSKYIAIPNHPRFLATVFAAFLAVFALVTPSTAKANGFEVMGAIGWHDEIPNDTPHADMNGFGVRLSAGYRFADWIGVFVNQDLGGAFNHWDIGGVRVRGSHFLGTTLVSANLFFPTGPLETFALIGIGATYTGKWHEHHHDHHADLGKGEGAFAFRVGIGATYMLPTNPKFGIGANFDYTTGAFEVDNEHIVDLMLHMRYKF